MVDLGWLPTALQILVLTSYTLESWEGRRRLHFRPHHNDHRHWGPFFEETPANASGPPGFSSGGVYAMAVPAGGPLRLDCRVAMLQDKLVVWVKKTAERVSLLTVGEALYSADSRISLKFLYPNNWRLEISPVQEGDEGLYMCQVSTHPPKVRATNLTVLSPEVMVVDEQGIALTERHYQQGSRIELLCRARLTHQRYLLLPNVTLEKLTWRKGTKITNLPIKSTSFSSESGTATALSRLIVSSAVPADSGTYSCQLEGQGQAFINVHVLQGETQAAVHHEASRSNRMQAALMLVFVYLHKFC